VPPRFRPTATTICRCPGQSQAQSWPSKLTGIRRMSDHGNLPGDSRGGAQPTDGGVTPSKSEDEWPTPDELTRYKAHEPVLAQATVFLTYITTTASLYATVTGAAWAVVLGNSFGARPTTLLPLLILHILLSFGVAIGIWGVGNNFILRLNFARWLGVKFWPNIERIGGRDYAWLGVPVAKPDTSQSLMDAAETFETWKDGRAKRTSWPSWHIDFWLRYRAPLWPSLRYQRLWAILPAIAACVSVAFAVHIVDDGDRHRRLCRAAAQTLAATPAPKSREFEQARYLFDKAGCGISHIHFGRPPN
jgi:hypothetical protein